MKVNLRSFKQKVRHNGKQLKSFLTKTSKHNSKAWEASAEKLNKEVWQEVDCLSCANCCKTTGPLFTDKDIDRISKFFKLKPQQFIEKYLRIDEENDYVLQRVPCVFLGKDNYCSIYDVRPKACREFPHTDRKKFHQISNLTLKNVAICPAAFNIVEEMKKRIKN